MTPSILFACLTLLFAPKASAESPQLPAVEPVEIRVGTYNIWGLPGLLTKPRWRHRRGLVNRFLGLGDFDVLAGQEVFDNAIDDLEPGPDLTTSTGDAGLGFWFGPKVRLYSQDFTRHFRTRRGVERLKRKGVIGAELSLEGGARVWVYDTHLQAYAFEGAAEARADQVAEIIEAVDARPGPAILLGDFNLHRGFEPDDVIAGALLAAGFRDVAAELGNTGEGTWSDTDLRLDRIYLRDGSDGCLTPTDYQVQKQALEPGVVVSDHHPVWARVRVEGCG